MTMTQINPGEEKQKKSALEKFATGLGIAQGVANIAVTGSQLASMGKGSANALTPMQQYLKKKSSIPDFGAVG